MEKMYYIYQVKQEGNLADDFVIYFNPMATMENSPSAKLSTSVQNSLKATINSNFNLSGYKSVFIYKGELADVKDLVSLANRAHVDMLAYQEKNQQLPSDRRYLKKQQKLGFLGLMGSVWQVSQNKTQVVFECQSEIECSKICLFLNKAWSGVH